MSEKRTPGVKLTKAQLEFLTRLERWGPGPADPSYGPAVAVLKAGYATKEVRRNKLRLHVFSITPAGRAAISKASRTREGEWS